MIETCPDEELVKRIDQDMEDMKDEMPFSFRVLVRELIRRYRLAKQKDETRIHKGK